MDAGSDWLLTWLTNLNLQEYHTVLAKNGLHTPDLLATSVMNREQLKAIGITKVGHMNRLIRAIEKLRTEGNGDALAPPLLPPPLLPLPTVAPVEQPVPEPPKRQATVVPPPVPTRNSTRRTSSNPALLQPAISTPPPPARCQSLRKKTVNQTSGSQEDSPAMANYPQHATSVNGTYETERLPPLEPPSTAASSTPHPHLSSPVAPRHAIPGGSPTPKPRQRPRPVPRQRSKSPSPGSDGDFSRSVSTLPAGSRGLMANGGINSQSLSNSYPSSLPRNQENNGLAAYSTLPPPVPRRVALNSSAPPPPLPPERKHNKEHSSASDMPVPAPPPDIPVQAPAPPPDIPVQAPVPPPAFASKYTRTLPQRERPKPPPPFQRRKSPEKPMVVPRGVAARPTPQPRSTTLPQPRLTTLPQPKNPSPNDLSGTAARQAPPDETKCSIVFLSNQSRLMQQELSDSEDESEDPQGKSPTSISPTNGQHGSSQAADEPEGSDIDDDSDQEAEGSHRMIGSVRQFSSCSSKDHEDDVIVGTLPSDRTKSGNDYMNQKSIDSALADISSDEDEEEVNPLKRLIVTQVISMERDDDDDEEEEENDVLKVAIHGKKEDYVNQAELDKIEVLSPGATTDRGDYLNHEVIDREMIVGKAVGGSDYMNEEVIGQVVQDTAPTGTNVEESGPDYVNQDGIGEGDMDEDEFWKAIESSNAANKFTIQTIATKVDSGGRKGYTNQEVIDTALRRDFGNISTDDYLTEDDYITTDDDEDEERITVRNSYRERLKIRGTLKSAEPGFDAGNDYENQYLLEGDIIPVTVAPDPEVLSFLKQAVTHGATTEAGSTRPQPEAVMGGGSSDGRMSAHYSSGTDEVDGNVRSAVCTKDPDESTLDFRCPHDIGSPMSPPPLPLKSPPPLPPKSPPILTPPSPPPPLPPTLSPPPESLSRTSTSSSASSMPGKPHVLFLDTPPPRNPSVMRQDTHPIYPKPRSHTTVMSEHAVFGIDTELEGMTPTSPRSSDAEFLSNDMGALSPSHRDYIPSKLPKSAGTFAGRESYKRPSKNTVSQIVLSSSMNSRNSVMRHETLSESSLLPGISARLGSESYDNVPQTKEGFLYKKGGRRNERPWQKRWVTFNGSELKYFKNKADKENLFLNTVELEKMFDVKKVTNEADKQYRFDLVVINRVFQFYSESLEDCQAWVTVLHVAISKFKPQDHEPKVGGSMYCPDKEGYLHKQGHGAFSSKSFRERYVALKGSKFAYYDSYDLYKLGRPIHTLDMCLSSVRPDMTSKVPRFVITMNNQKQYHFQASTDLERNEWVSSLTNAILTGIETRPQTLPRGGTKIINNSQAVLTRVQENRANKTCADCSANDPVWGVINRGIMVCINCSGVHRSFGAHISKVRSIELDEEVWKNENLIKLMVEIGNNNSNLFWESHYKGDKLAAKVEREIRVDFLRAKYLTRSWILTEEGETKESLNRKLCTNVTTINILRTIELLALGADSCYLISEEEDPEKSTPLAIARSSNQVLQAELLELNGASICMKDQPSFSVISKKGHLFKTGSDRTGWKRRYCTLDQFRGFEYFKVETDLAPLGYIHMEELLSVEKCDEESSREHRHCFEVNTQGRGYLFSAESEAELKEWIDTFQKIVTSDAADNLGYDKVGYLKKKDPLSVGGWKKRWYTLKGKSLACYKREREEQDEIDLRKVVQLKGPDSVGSPEQQCVFSIVTDEKTYNLKAESLADAEAWVAALRHTQVSGVPLAEQILTNSNVPIIVHKCLQFVESTGLDTEGLYRINGEKAKIRKLILAFNQDAQGVVIDPEKYNVHDVTGTLKQFLRSLPHPVVTHDLYPEFIATVQSDYEGQMYRLQALVNRMPNVSRETLKRIIQHLRRVIENESKNKMSDSNITRLLGPTLMTVDVDDRSFDHTPFQYMCIHRLISSYKWIFQVEEDENKKEEAIEEAVQKIKELELQQKKRLEMVNQKQSTISSATDFLTTVYIGNREGDSFNTNIIGSTTVQQVVEKTVANKGLPADMYALYIILGDHESQRVLCFAERLLGVMCGAGTDHFLCLRRNEFFETLEPYFETCGAVPVSVHVREKKRWRKYPCCVRDGQFIQFKDAKCHNEVYRAGVNGFDVFAGIQRSRLDVKNPMPTRYGFWIKSMKSDDQSRYFCADKEDDMMKIMAAIIKTKYPSCLQSPVLPVHMDSPSPPPYSECTSSVLPPQR